MFVRLCPLNGIIIRNCLTLPSTAYHLTCRALERLSRFGLGWAYASIYL